MTPDRRAMMVVKALFEQDEDAALAARIRAALPKPAVHVTRGSGRPVGWPKGLKRHGSGGEAVMPTEEFYKLTGEP